MEPPPNRAASERTLRDELESAKREAAELGGWSSFRTGDWTLALIQKAFRSYYERATSDYFRQKYPGRDNRFIAQKLVSVAARNASIVGALTGAVVSADEILAITTGAEGGVGLPANLAIAVSAVMSESVVLLRIQLQLVAELARLHGAPLDPDDPEDILTILAFALGGAAAEAAGKAGMKVGAHAARASVRRHLSVEAVAALKLVGRRLGVKVLQRTMAKYALPIASVAIGAGWNYVSTRAVAKIAHRHLGSG